MNVDHYVSVLWTCRAQIYFSDICLAAFYRLWSFWRSIILGVHEFSEHFSCRIVFATGSLSQSRTEYQTPCDFQWLGGYRNKPRWHGCSYGGGPTRLRITENLAKSVLWRSSSQTSHSDWIIPTALSAIPLSTWSLNTSKGGDLTEYRIGSLVQCCTILQVSRFCFSGATRTSQASAYCPLYVIAQLYLLYAAFVTQDL